MLAAAAALLALAASTASAADVCNGHAELCGKKYSNVTFIGAHDSAFVGRETGANQDYNVTKQLDDGIRLLQSQIHDNNGELRLCHTSCAIFDGGKVSDYLASLRSWLDANPDEVVTTLFTNPDSLNVSTISAQYEAAGIDASVSYAPSSATVALDEWPTLGELIDSGKRVVNFIDHHADFTSMPWIIDEFANIFEDPFNAVENAFPCTKDRPSGGSTDDKMYLSNHFLDTKSSFLGIDTYLPDMDSLETTNGVSGTGSLGQGAQTCAALWGRYPNFFLVDYYAHGNGSVFEVAADLNRVSYQNPGDIYPAGNSTSGGSSAGSEGGGNNGASVVRGSWKVGMALVGALAAVAL